MRRLVSAGLLAVAILAPAALTHHVAARDWVPFSKLPNADKVRAAQRNLGAGPRGGRARDVRFDVEGKQLAYRRGDKWFVVPFAGGEPTAVDEPAATFVAPREDEGRRRGAAARGRQVAQETSPDGARVASHRDGNVWINERGGDAWALTTDGNAKIKYGTASWVYGEELDQTTAMWWSPDSKKLAFYRFDDTNVIEFGLPVGWTKLRPTIETEAYPKPGEPNPIATLMIFDFEKKSMVNVDVGPDREQYVYGIEWLPDSSGILYRRTNRRQDTLDLVVAAADTGASRVVLTEKQDTWQENSPQFRWLTDGKRFLWESEATGFSQYQLWSIDGTKLAQLTTGDYPVESIVRVDEAAGELWYTARSSETKINTQLHRVKLDGTGAVRLTPDDLEWSGFAIAPDGSCFVATSEFVDVLPSSHLFGRDGAKLATLAQAEGDPWAEAGVGKPEFVRLVAADGTTPIYGILSKPSTFDASKQYPLVVSAYGGPAFTQISPRFSMGRPECEFGLLMLTIDNRGTPGRGKAFEAANYLSLGEEDCDDQAAAAKQIAERPYVAKDKIAITGHSYGGYMTLIAMLRYPDIFKVGVAGAPPTDWRNYDTIYTERYMRTPAENPEGYDNFSCVKLAENLRGKLLLLHGMVDDNVHPTNSWQFVDALQQKERPFEMMFFPRSDHGIFSPSAEGVKWSFLLEHLGLR
ncbi:MAG: DPP IV N-terminal domain-containing protein [Phycisphaerae bacterium]|nr:DPP IV N-terminal domain-containing protein [Phycisphaerae bacterium]